MDENKKSVLEEKPKTKSTEKMIEEAIVELVGRKQWENLIKSACEKCIQTETLYRQADALETIAKIINFFAESIDRSASRSA